MDPNSVRPSEKFDTPYWTTNSGQPVFNNNDSLTVGRRGPVLLEDYHLIEKLSQFDRERIPERVVHARGASAKGYFEVTHDISHLTFADVFRAPGVQTPLITRFSTVIHERGSPESLRDPRGFAVKFYTREGNWDLVGNNFPVFFVRDGMKFPDLIHAFKPNPITNVQEFWRIWDFLSHHPGLIRALNNGIFIMIGDNKLGDLINIIKQESLHMLTFLLDDMGIPLNYRHMEGAGVHTFKLINKDAKETYVKFLWIPKQGVKNLLDDEAVTVGGQNHQHATQDLYDSIAKGDYPEWTLYIQTMDPKDEDKFDFDPLDPTKTWPENIFPLQPVGKMVLNKNIDNFFQENEMLAFGPGLIVPGIGFSNDKLLQTRTYSYSDTQRYRVGPNYLLLPVNAPKCPHHNNHFDGFMNFLHRDSDVNYFPSRIQPSRHAAQYPIVPETIHGQRTKQVIPKENNFQQPGERFRSFDPARQDRFINRVSEKLSGDRVTRELRRVWVSYWTQADATLGRKIQEKLQEKALL